MTLESKWLAEIAFAEPVSSAARFALLKRIHSVMCYLPLAATCAERDPEYIHQLRVTTRRARAVLDLVRGLLPRKRRQQWRRSLREIRQTVGLARELDVLLAQLQPAPPLEDLETHQSNGEAANWSAFGERLLSFRRELQPEVQTRLARFPLDRLWAEALELARRCHWREESPEPTWGAFTSQALTTTLRRYLDEARQIGLAPGDASHLHAFRILGKQVRYQAEIAAEPRQAAFPRRLHEHLSRAQERLGEINDLHTLIQRIDDWISMERFSDFRDLLQSWRASANRRIDRQEKAFFRWWQYERLEDLCHDWMNTADR